MIRHTPLLHWFQYLWLIQHSGTVAIAATTKKKRKRKKQLKKSHQIFTKVKNKRFKGNKLQSVNISKKKMTQSGKQSLAPFLTLIIPVLGRDFPPPVSVPNKKTSANCFWHIASSHVSKTCTLYIHATNHGFDIKRTGLEKSLFSSCKKEHRVQKERKKKREHVLSFLWRCNFTKHIKPRLNSDPWMVPSSGANPPTGQLLQHPFSFFPPRSQPHSLTFSSVWTFSEPVDSLTEKKIKRHTIA